MTLRAVHTVVCQELLRFATLDALGDRAFAEALRDGDERRDDELVGAVGRAAGDELAVDLEVVEREVLEVVEAAEAGAEVIERETAPERGQPLGEAVARAGCSRPRPSR